MGETLANLANDHKFAKFSSTKFSLPKIDLEYNIDFEHNYMECPWLDERLQSLAVVACSHALFVHESCAFAMQYRGVVSLSLSTVVLNSRDW